MKIAVRYQSKSGNTEKVAQAIAGEIGAEAKQVDTPLSENVDLLFLGGAIYVGGLNKDLKNFMKDLKPGQAKQIVFFSTAMGPGGIHDKAEKFLQDSGSVINPNEFHAQSKELDEALPKAAEFARDIVKELQ